MCLSLVTGCCTSLSCNIFQKINSNLSNITRQSGDAYYYDGATSMREYPFIFKKVLFVLKLNKCLKL